MANAISSEWVSRREAARLLGCACVTLDRIAARNGLRIRQIPGHKRKFLYRAELAALLAKSESVAKEARA